VEGPLRELRRPVRLLAAGGTIGMSGAQAVPALEADELIEAVPALAAVPALEAETVLSVPSAHLSLGSALEVARLAAGAADGGRGVVISTGTDTLEELAVLCALLHGADAPIVVTGANRPASAPGSDGPANLIDAVALAGADAARGLGTVVVFAGEIHDAMTVRKVDSTGPAAFGSPISGPLGRVVEGRVWLNSRPSLPATLDIRALAHRVEIVSPGIGDDGDLLRHVASRADGVVLVAFGAGHLPVAVLDELGLASERVPVVLTCRPERSSMLVGTYGFRGAERDLRASGAICAPFLSLPAARMVLLGCLGAGLERPAMYSVLGQRDVAA
jgi:L-asparaginase